jgi:formylmethanofuran dehydrogenase subunit E
MERELLNKMFEFHGHKCWASALGLRVGLLALKKLGVERAKAKELYVILETGYHHAAGCFGDGVQFATGCTLGKGTLIRKPKGKLAFTLIDPKQKRQIRLCFNPKIREKILASSFMKKRGAGIPPHEIPEEEVMEVINLVLDSPIEEALLVGEVKELSFELPKEVMGLEVCEICGEPVAKAYIRIIGTGQDIKKVCVDCSGYPEGFEK